ncbi:MAG: trehalose-6-phosphate synthase [Candidatus Altiarchaeales archaeon]|nr:trehalose-6-phosphate synthase [Candidatus Altiarchaeales archaeon]
MVTLVKEKLGDAKLIVASNREPYMHVWRGEEIKTVRPASGMAVALDSIMQACGGTWVAHGAGDADQEVVDEENVIEVPQKNPKYRLKRVWMTKKEEQGYYDITSNELFWPLCHTVYVRPKFNERAWNEYKKINQRFANAILEEIGDEQAFIWFQDFHLSLAPRMIKNKKQDLVTAHFWHIPWPQNETFRACPWKHKILDGLLANDLIGFHTRYHCNNFLETVDRNLVSKTDRSEYSVLYKHKKTYVKPFPISVDYHKIKKMAEEPERQKTIKPIKHRLNLENKVVGVGVERVDYTKGIPEKLKALEWFLEKNPQYKEKLTYIQIGSPSRLRLEEYRSINEEIEELVEDINWRQGTKKWTPIIYLSEHHDFEDIINYYMLADFCIVSSLHDGMNLVAKEYISSKTNADGMLILSRFTGAQEELTDALLVNPYDTRRFAAVIKKLLTLKAEKKKERMQKLRDIVEENNIYTWAGNIVSNISKIA